MFIYSRANVAKSLPLVEKAIKVTKDKLTPYRCYKSLVKTFDKDIAVIRSFVINSIGKKVKPVVDKVMLDNLNESIRDYLKSLDRPYVIEVQSMPGLRKRLIAISKGKAKVVMGDLVIKIDSDALYSTIDTVNAGEELYNYLNDLESIKYLLDGSGRGASPALDRGQHLLVADLENRSNECNGQPVLALR